MKQHHQWKAILLAAALSAAPLFSASPRWVSIGPPAGPTSARLVLDPASDGRAFAITAAGLLRTQNGGRTWGFAQNGLDGLTYGVAFDPAHPGRVYASVQDLDYRASLRRSDDYGDHWSVLYRSPVSFLALPQPLAVDPFVPDTLYWLRNKLLFRSQDGGRSWSCLPAGATCGTGATPLSGLALSLTSPGTVYTQFDARFFTSFNGGASWSSVPLPPNPLPGPGASEKPALQATPEFFPTRTPHQLYLQAGYASTACFLRSDDDGATWHAYLRDRACGNPAVDPDDPETIRIAVYNGVDPYTGPQLWVSHDGGETGAFVGALPALGDLYEVAGGGFLLATDQGIFRAASEAGPWLPANRGFNASTLSSVLATEDALFASPSVQINDYGPPPAVPLQSSADGGRSWTPEPLINPSTLAADPRDPRHLIASAYRVDAAYNVFYRVLESLDGSQSWNGVVAPGLDIPFFTSLAIDPFDARTFYGGTLDLGFYRSRDGGRTWQRSNSGLPIRTTCEEHYCAPNDVPTILADPGAPGRLTIHFRFQVFGSVDGGAHWKLSKLPIPANGLVEKLTRGPGETLLAITSPFQPADLSSLGILYRSVDDGKTWKRVGRLPSGAGAATAVQLTGFVATEAGVFVGTNVLGVLWSRGGKSWSTLNEGLPFPTITALAADPSNPRRIYAVVPQNGVYAIEVP